MNTDDVSRWCVSVLVEVSFGQIVPAGSQHDAIANARSDSGATSLASTGFDSELQATVRELRSVLVPLINAVPDNVELFTSNARLQFHDLVSAAQPIVVEATEMARNFTDDQASIFRSLLSSGESDLPREVRAWQVLDEVVQRAPEAVLEDASLEAASAELVSDLLLLGVFGGSTEATFDSRGSQLADPTTSEPRRLTGAVMQQVFDKLGVRRRNAKHHVAGFVELDGKPALAVHFSLGKNEIPGRVVTQIRRSFKVSEGQFQRLVSCTMTAEEYRNHLREVLSGD